MKYWGAGLQKRVQIEKMFNYLHEHPPTYLSKVKLDKCGGSKIRAGDRAQWAEVLAWKV